MFRSRRIMTSSSTQQEALRSITIRVEETDIVGLLRASLDPLSVHAAVQRIELRVVTLGIIPRVAVDREKIAWCITTLVGNALRYVKKGEGEGDIGGSVLVQIENDDTSPDIVAIAVQDDGPGIPDDKLPYLFERRRGAMHADGLALSLIREIVSAHGGDICVESRRGLDEHGTSITLRLGRSSSGPNRPFDATASGVNS
jgi:two-component system, OmpR family, phosphate regulon sensor histidine kinase PhoR